MANTTQAVSYDYEDKEREIICFDANMIQVWDHLEDFFFSRWNIVSKTEKKEKKKEKRIE